jgi:hydrogenase small subunit
MKGVTRRDFLAVVGAAGASLGLTPAMLAQLRQVLASGARPPVVWLQGQSCSGCSVSLLNSIYNATIDSVLTGTIDLKFHPTMMAAAGDLAVSEAEAAWEAGGYVLVVEGAIPTGSSGSFCRLWPEMTMEQALQRYATNAAYILAVGTCASYGGIPAGAPNPTTAKSVQLVIGATPKLVNLPGCPVHPDWVVGAIAHILATGAPPELDTFKRPTLFYGNSVHMMCPRLGTTPATQLGDPGCMMPLGCKGPMTFADCPVRKWNSGAVGEFGQSWCIGTNNICQGCTEYNFPDGMSPLYLGGLGGGGGGSGGHHDDDDDDDDHHGDNDD